MTESPKRRPSHAWKRLLMFLSVFGPATITAMADNDAGGIATYSVAGARLGYPILFPLILITLLLAITQEMGMRLTVITRRGLADLIREKYGVRISLLIFAALMISNFGTLVTELSAVLTTSSMFGLPPAAMVFAIVLISFLVVTLGNYRLTQSIMLLASLFFISYIFSAFQAKPNWGLALGNLFYPHGVTPTRAYVRDYLIISIGVLGTTITPWGQFFISSFTYDKKIKKGRIYLAQFEAYLGAFLTDFFSFFMIVATATTLFVNHIPLESGEQAAMAIKPFAGDLAGELFAFGILNAAFMGVVVVSLSTAYAFAEFFGISGSLNDSFRKGKSFYVIYIAQLVMATLVILFSRVSLFKLAIVTQTINAVMLPPVLYYLVKLTSNRDLMGQYANNTFQRSYAITCTVLIVVGSFIAVGAMLFTS